MKNHERGVPMATGSVTVDAVPAAVYSLVTDLDVLASLAEETQAMAWISGTRAEPAAVFAGKNRNGLRRWTTRCTVTDADETAFAFDVTYGPFSTPIAHWRYDFTAVKLGCQVTESMWDQRPAWFRGVGGLATGVSDRATVNTQHIAATLERLKARASAL